MMTVREFLWGLLCKFLMILICIAAGAYALGAATSIGARMDCESLAAQSQLQGIYLPRHGCYVKIHDGFYEFPSLNKLESHGVQSK